MPELGEDAYPSQRQSPEREIEVDRLTVSVMQGESGRRRGAGVELGSVVDIELDSAMSPSRRQKRAGTDTSDDQPLSPASSARKQQGESMSGQGVSRLPGPAPCHSSTSSSRPDGMGKHGFSAAVFNFVNSIVGAGIIGLPYALEQSGMGFGLILMLVCAWLTDCSVRMLVSIGADSDIDSYEEVCLRYLGQRGKTVVSVAMFLFAFSAMLAYLVLIGDTVPAVLGHWTGKEWAGDRTLVVTVFAVGICLPLSSLRDIGKLAGTSALSIFAVVIIVVIVAATAPDASDRQKISSGESNGHAFAFFHGGSFQAFGTMSFAYVCHHSSYLVRGSMRRPALWNRVTHISILIATVLSLILSTTGYSYFRRCTRPDILNNFETDVEEINVARVLLALTMFLTYPMEFFVARQVLNTVCFRGEQMPPLRHWVTTGAIFATSLAIALLLRPDDLGTVLNVSGGTCASIVGFVIPALCYISYRSVRRGTTWWRVMLSGEAAFPAVLIVIGTVALSTNLYYAIEQAVLGTQEKPYCPKTGL
eukprot:TRINITY_DN40425_c0_g1_i1.p1 TRINITY_DN40425_c0_g1~~TRINITY_DN40425_c0_g1_i1.p1  ORF type:complete len:556 (+),score=152.79 TRINITY_DN40425_c0_g1_i1:70-1668(+)